MFLVKIAKDVNFFFLHSMCHTYAALELAVTQLGKYDPEEDDFPCGHVGSFRNVRIR
jgi:hypothetical protein